MCVFSKVPFNQRGEFASEINALRYRRNNDYRYNILTEHGPLRRIILFPCKLLLNAEIRRSVRRFDDACLNHANSFANSSFFHRTVLKLILLKINERARNRSKHYCFLFSDLQRWKYCDPERFRNNDLYGNVGFTVVEFILKYIFFFHRSNILVVLCKRYKSEAIEWLVREIS